MFNLSRIDEYLRNLNDTAAKYLPSAVELILNEIEAIERSSSKIFLCGNGGSGANAIHIENDLSLGIFKLSKRRFVIETLGSNLAISGAISNDYSYSEVFSQQLSLKANQNDLLIVLSGSGNSENIIEVLKVARALGVRTCAVVGFDGGLAKELSDVSVHFPVNDMQVVEDLQLILGHLVMRQFDI